MSYRALKHIVLLSHQFLKIHRLTGGAFSIYDGNAPLFSITASYRHMHALGLLIELTYTNMGIALIMPALHYF